MSIVVVLAERGTHRQVLRYLSCLDWQCRAGKNSAWVTRRRKSCITASKTYQEWAKHHSTDENCFNMVKTCIKIYQICFESMSDFSLTGLPQGTPWVNKMSRFLRQKMSTITAIINTVTQRIMRDPWSMFVHLDRVCLKVDFFLFNATHAFLEI